MNSEREYISNSIADLVGLLYDNVEAIKNDIRSIDPNVTFGYDDCDDNGVITLICYTYCGEIYISVEKDTITGGCRVIDFECVFF